MEQILEGRFRPGDRLPTEQTLAREHGASRITVREALSILSGVGVIEHGQGQRRRIRQPDAEVLSRLFRMMVAMESGRTFDDVFFVRRALETAAVRLAAVMRNEAQLENLRANVASYRAALESDEAEIVRQRRAVVLDGEFHLLIAGMTGNAVLLVMMKTLSVYVAEVQLRACLGNLKRNLRALAAHQRILRALELRDGDAAAIEMAHHLQVSSEEPTGNEVSF